VDTAPILYTRFRTSSKHYIYDAYSNQILATSQRVWENLDRVLGSQRPLESDFVPDAGVTAEVRSAVRSAQGLGQLLPCDVRSMRFYDNEATLRDRIRRHVSHLALEVTEACNFSCRYCPHTFDDGRMVRRKSMAWPTAEKAIASFVERSSEASGRSVSFWGGEPLIAFRTIRRVVDFIEAAHPSMRPAYSFTTNGSLITQSVAAYLARMRFDLTVSVDGPEDAHDRFRISRKTQGTHRGVLAGLTRLVEADAEYYRKHVQFNCVLTPGTDLARTFAFFDAHPLFTGHRVRFSRVAPDGTTFYQQYGTYSEDQEDLLRKQSTAPSQSPDAHTAYKRRRFLNLAVRDRTPLRATVPPNGCCVPLLKKMLVTVAGDIYMCERMPYDLPLGNIHRGGVDDDRVVSLVDEYARRSLPDCGKCWAVRLCGLCYRDCIRNGEWKHGAARDRLCESQRASIAARLVDYAAMIEADPAALDIFDGVTVNRPA